MYRGQKILANPFQSEISSSNLPLGAQEAMRKRRQKDCEVETSGFFEKSVVSDSVLLGQTGVEVFLLK